MADLENTLPLPVLLFQGHYHTTQTMATTSIPVFSIPSLTFASFPLIPKLLETKHCNNSGIVCKVGGKGTCGIPYYQENPLQDLSPGTREPSPLIRVSICHSTCHFPFGGDM